MYYTANNATLKGEIEIREDVSIWYGAVLRADHNRIRIGAGSNIQDLCMIHVDRNAPVEIGEDCVIGHRCILHGCTLKDRVLVGMGAIVMDHAVIGEDSVIGAGALVLEGTVIPPGSRTAHGDCRGGRRVCGGCPQGTGGA